MGATATLSTADLSVVPGGDVTCQVVVRNAGELVDQFTLDVVGDAASWSRAEPAVSASGTGFNPSFLSVDRH